MVRKTNTAPRARRALEGADAARTLWLAGLGAVSLAQKQGGKLIETLVAEGEDFKVRTERFANTLVRDLRRAANDAQAQVEGVIQPLRAKAVQAVRDVEAGVNERFGDVLGRLGLARKPKAVRKVKRVVRRGKAKVGRRRAA
ncbi:MAG: phasin family protein [Xanthomonadaceae bacterium]|jgi:poly(hydroxyalkanoate) granule-associated protein|nr:phasin family protein [Xanthomonadaceae bacterium]